MNGMEPATRGGAMPFRLPQGGGAGDEVVLFGRRVRVYDLSQCLSNETSAIEPMPHHIEYVDHLGTISVSERRFGLGAEYWRDGLGWAQEHVTLTTHSGTHVDAPYHYAPTSGGEPARTIDQVPFSWLMGDGFLLDMRHVNVRLGITEDDVRNELQRIGYAPKAGDIALVRTDASRRFGEAGYDQLHVGMRESATRYLVSCGIRLIGIDAWGFDRPLSIMVEEAKGGDRSQLWEAHYYGAVSEYSQIEKLVNLEALPMQHGFTVIALPIKIERASGAWARVVALCPA